MKAKQTKNTFTITGVTLGQLMAIRNGLGYAVKAGIVTPVQEDVYNYVGQFLEDAGVPIASETRDPDGFLSEVFGITAPSAEEP